MPPVPRLQNGFLSAIRVNECIDIKPLEQWMAYNKVLYKLPVSSIAKRLFLMNLLPGIPYIVALVTLTWPCLGEISHEAEPTLLPCFPSSRLGGKGGRCERYEAALSSE